MRHVTSQVLSDYVHATLHPLHMQSLVLLQGEEARGSAIMHGWAHITEASCRAVSMTAARLLANEPERQRCASAVAALRAEFQGRLDQPAWPTMAGRMSGESMPLLEWMRRMQQLLDRSVAVIDAAAVLNAQASAPAPAAWLDELRRARVGSLQMNLKMQALVYNTLWGRMDVFLDACQLAVEELTRYIHDAAAALQHRERWMRQLMEWSRQHGSASVAGSDADARDLDAAAALLYVSPFCVEQQHLQEQKERAQVV